MPNPMFFKLLWQLERRAFSRARANTGNKIVARIAIIAMTTKSSISVKPGKSVRRDFAGHPDFRRTFAFRERAARDEKVNFIKNFPIVSTYQLYYTH